MEEYRDIIRQLIITINKLDGIYYQWARSLGAKENMFYLIYALDDGKAHSQKQISEEWLIPKTTINTVVKEGVEEGYITLTAEEHSREKLISLTEEGKNYAEKLLRGIYKIEEKAMKKTLDEYTPEFVRAMEMFSENFSQSFHKQKKEKSNMRR